MLPIAVLDIVRHDIGVLHRRNLFAPFASPTDLESEAVVDHEVALHSQVDLVLIAQLISKESLAQGSHG